MGNNSKGDAAAYDIGNNQVILSSTDFFMPIVDEPFDFGRIAVTNAISDIYAMGGKPIMAIAILGWPVNVLPPEVARRVIDGGRQACAEAGMMLAGGHSIDAPEPIFGLAVTGIVNKDQLKQNNTATVGCRLYLTKPLGVGILTSAQKQKKLRSEHQFVARDVMCQMNKVGAEVAHLPGVEALTDVTGFGLLGHLLEVCEGSGVNAVLFEPKIPLLPAVRDYIAQGCLLGGALQKTQKRPGGALFQEINALLQQALVAHQRGDPSLHRAWLERMLRGYDDPMYEYQLAHRYGVAEFTGTPTEVREYLRQSAQCAEALRVVFSGWMLSSVLIG